MKILGYSGLNHDSAVALLDAGRIAFAIESEKVTRYKHEMTPFPEHAFRHLLGHAGVPLSDIDYLAVNYEAGFWANKGYVPHLYACLRQRNFDWGIIANSAVLAGSHNPIIVKYSISDDVPRILPVLQTRFPELRLELRETQTRQLVDDIKNGALDAAMLALPVDEADIDSIALFEDLFLLAVPAADPRPATTRVAVEDIDQARLLLLEDGHCLRDQALALCAGARGRNAASVGTGFGASSLATVMQMVAGGYGVTLVPQIAADVERRDSRVKFLRLKNPEPGRRIGLVFRRTSPRKADFAALGEVVKASVGVSAGDDRQ